MAAGAENKMIRVISSDGEHFELPESAARLSRILLHMIEDDCADAAGITLPNVAGDTLAKVVDYCTTHAAAATAAGGSSSTPPEGKDLKSFDEDLIEVDTDMLYDLIMAANYMGVEGLLTLAVERTADLIRGKSPEEIRKTFRIANDFTPEVEEEIRRENEWVFD